MSRAVFTGLIFIATLQTWTSSLEFDPAAGDIDLECAVNDWDRWGPCIGDCDFALRVRNRDVLNSPFPKQREDGMWVIQPCPQLYQVIACKPVHCQNASDFNRRLGTWNLNDIEEEELDYNDPMIIPTPVPLVPPPTLGSGSDDTISFPSIAQSPPEFSANQPDSQHTLQLQIQQSSSPDTKETFESRQFSSGRRESISTDSLGGHPGPAIPKSRTQTHLLQRPGTESDDSARQSIFNRRRRIESRLQPDLSATAPPQLAPMIILPGSSYDKEIENDPNGDIFTLNLAGAYKEAETVSTLEAIKDTTTNILSKEYGEIGVTTTTQIPPITKPYSRVASWDPFKDLRIKEVPKSSGFFNQGQYVNVDLDEDRVSTAAPSPETSTPHSVTEEATTTNTPSTPKRAPFNFLGLPAGPSKYSPNRFGGYGAKRRYSSVSFGQRDESHVSSFEETSKSEPSSSQESGWLPSWAAQD